MTYKLTAALMAAVAVITVSSMTTVAKADEWNRETLVTFNTPVEVFHEMLPPGTYIFKLADTSGSRNIVQIYTRDRQHLVTSFIALRAHRGSAAHSSVTVDYESSKNPVVNNWFYANDEDGQTFPRPK